MKDNAPFGPDSSDLIYANLMAERLGWAADWQDHWTDWQWQQRNALRRSAQIKTLFPDVDEEALDKTLERQKLLITPYYMGLCLAYQDAHPAADENPLLLQVLPSGSPERDGGFDHQTENWEQSSEMKTPICQHKYDNRVIIRASNVCNAYCQFCFEALRTLSKDNAARKESLQGKYWRQTLDYIADTHTVEEVILSGGEPLMLRDEKLDRMLSDLRAVRPDIVIRVHTRALSFNPYRVTPELIESFARHDVNALGVHVCHPAELTDAFWTAIESVRPSVRLIFANIPLLGSVNDDQATLETLCMTLYRNGVLPYYLYHFMPFSPGSAQFSVPVEQGMALARSMKRRKTNLAVPEYVLPHLSGKYTVPLDDPAHPPAAFTNSDAGQPVFSFTNWKGQACTWANG
ncbi:MAG: radical SAM protein [Paracoccaceae bacterium]|nr:radical SAM protein [Paracoccaceae bacterium]